jgi:hypothetical protein
MAAQIPLRLTEIVTTGDDDCQKKLKALNEVSLIKYAINGKILTIHS